MFDIISYFTQILNPPSHLCFLALHCTTGVEGEVETGTGTVLKLESENESESMPVVLISCHVMLCEEFRFRCCQFVVVGVGVN